MGQSARSFFFLLPWFVVSGLFAANAASAITSLAAGSALPGKSQTFTWGAGDSAVTQEWLYAGNKVGISTYYNSNAVVKLEISKVCQ